VQDLDKTLPSREESLSDENNKIFLFEPPRNNQMKHSTLRIKPLVMKRSWRGMCMKKNKNFDEVRHVKNLDETSVPVLPLDEDEVVQPCFPLAHEDEDVISPNDVDVFVKDLSNMVD
jgi:hypothetical protein